MFKPEAGESWQKQRNTQFGLMGSQRLGGGYKIHGIQHCQPYRNEMWWRRDALCEGYKCSTIKILQEKRGTLKSRV